MAVTHADLAIDLSVGRRCASLGSKLATFVMFLSTVLGLLAFIFGLVAESTRTEAIWIMAESKGGDSDDLAMKCLYTTDGWSPLVAALGSMLSLVMAMGIGQAYMYVALCSPPPANDQFRPLAAWTKSDSNYYRKLRWQAAVSFVFSWICFGVAAVLLSVGIGVEAGHTERWSVAREKCKAVRVGVFGAAGVIGLLATSMAVVFYVSAVQTERLVEEEANIRREVMEATTYYTPDSSASTTISIQEIPVRALPEK